METGQLQHTFYDNLPMSAALALSTNGKWLTSSSSNGIMRIWNLSTGALLETLDCPHMSIERLKFSKDDYYLLGTSFDDEGDCVMVWETNSFDLVFAIQLQYRIDAITFSSTGRLIAVGGILQEDILVLETATGDTLHRLQKLSAASLKLNFAANDDLLITGGDDNHMKIYHTGSGNLEKDILCEGKILEFSQNGKLLALAVSSGELHIRRTMENSLQSVLFGSQHETRSQTRRYAFSLDEKRFVELHVNTAINVWDTITGNLYWNCKTTPFLIGRGSFSVLGSDLAGVVYSLGRHISL